MPSRARSSGSRPSRFLPLKSTSPPSIEYPGWPISAYDSVDLPDPFGPMTACTSPLLMARVTPLRISLPSTLARRSRISKSANSIAPFLHLICAIRRGLAHPRRALHRSSQQALVHLLFVLARQRRPHRDVLDGAVAVLDREPASRQLDDLSHVAVLGSEPRQLAHALVELKSREARRVLGLEPGRAAFEEPLQLLLVEKLDEVAGKLPVRMGEVLRRRGGQRVNVLRPASAVRLRVRHGRKTVSVESLQARQGGLLGDLQMRRYLAKRGVTPSFQESEDDVSAGAHRGNH